MLLSTDDIPGRISKKQREPDELFAGPVFLRNKKIKKEIKYTQSTASGVLLSPVSHCTVALPSLGVMLFPPRMMNSKRSVKPPLFPFSLSITVCYCSFYHHCSSTGLEYVQNNKKDEKTKPNFAIYLLKLS